MVPQHRAWGSIPECPVAKKPLSNEKSLDWEERASHMSMAGIKEPPAFAKKARELCIVKQQKRESFSVTLIISTQLIRSCKLPSSIN